RASGSPSTYTGIVGKLLAAFLELRNKLNIQATISCVPAHAGIDGNEKAHSEARAAVRQMASAPNAFHNSAGEAAGPADPSVVKESVKQRRRRTLRHLREEREERPDEQLRSVPPMPNDLPRSTQTLVRRLATNSVLSPALRHKFFGDDPDEGACRRCGRTATASHVVWECERHARLRKTKLEELPDEIRPATYVDWILPTSRDKTIVSLLWTKLAEFVRESKTALLDQLIKKKRDLPRNIDPPEEPTEVTMESTPADSVSIATGCSKDCRTLRLGQDSDTVCYCSSTVIKREALTSQEVYG
ncbi:hypothetical protein HPB47_017012, partial [Ixodes persulcatus]